MKKFEGWMTSELQYIATLLAGRELEFQSDGILNLNHELLYGEIIREIRNRRVKEELFQMKLKWIEEE